jgi:photosystem II stability/assembly factor-like uncharacterized protein
MQLSFHPIWVLSFLLCPLSAQEQLPATPPQASPPPSAVLENTGKPIVLPFECTEGDIQWAGLSCSAEEPCPVYVELTNATSVGDHLFAVGNIHSAAVTLYSVLLASEDGGHLWREPHPRVRSAGLDWLQFADSANGWAAGEELFPLPQNPFVLRTTDGGKTWRQQPVLRESAEDRFGSILQFHFGSPETGSLILDRGQGNGSDRYALFESPDGGDSWSIKEESGKLLRLKAAPAASSEWRVRADGPTQAYQLERRSGDRWVSHAAFAVKLGVCKPQ